MINWQKLKREVRIFIAALVFALLLAGSLLFLNLQAADQWQQSKNQLLQATQRFHTASDQKLILAQYQKRFQALKNQQVFGDEQRIGWIETIQTSSNQHAIPSVKFSLDQRTSATLPGDIAGIAVYVSTMRLELSLLHEGDLYHLFADLDEQAKGLYGVKDCALKHATKENANNGFGSSLTGTCVLNWYTLGEIIEIQYDENGEPITTDQPVATYSAEGDDL